MKCYICDRNDDGISWNSLHKDFNPCYECMSVITELKFKDIPKEDGEVDNMDEEVDDHVFC